MKSKKGSYVKIYKAIEYWVVEIGNEFDCFRIACSFEDIKNLYKELTQKVDDEECFLRNQSQTMTQG